MANIQIIGGIPTNWTHGPLLLKYFTQTKGPFLEMGMGYFSTPYLSFLNDNRIVVSTENNENFYNLFKVLETDFHKMLYVKNWREWDGYDMHQWEVAFVDLAPAADRVFAINKLRNVAKYIIVHDSEQLNNKDYHFEGIFDTFKYSFKYTTFNPQTIVMSDTHPLL